MGWTSNTWPPSLPLYPHFGRSALVLAIPKDAFPSSLRARFCARAVLWSDQRRLWSPRSASRTSRPKFCDPSQELGNPKVILPTEFFTRDRIDFHHKYPRIAQLFESIRRLATSYIHIYSWCGVSTGSSRIETMISQNCQCPTRFSAWTGKMWTLVRTSQFPCHRLAPLLSRLR